MHYIEKIIVIITFATCTNFAYCQDAKECVSGIVEYGILVDGVNSIDTISNISQRRMFKRVKSILDSKTFRLEFNKNESLFQSQKSMSIKNDNDDPVLRIADLLAKDSKIYYTNIDEQIKLKQIEFSGEMLIIDEGFNSVKWNITDESKQILGFTCFKATTQIKEYNNITKQTRIFTPEVWFCPSINFPFGPIGLDGLPGLILEGSINNKLTYQAKSINIDNPNVYFPKLKGKRISKIEFDKILAEIKRY